MAVRAEILSFSLKLISEKLPAGGRQREWHGDVLSTEAKFLKHLQVNCALHFLQRASDLEFASVMRHLVQTRDYLYATKMPGLWHFWKAQPLWKHLALHPAEMNNVCVSPSTASPRVQKDLFLHRKITMINPDFQLSIDGSCT